MFERVEKKSLSDAVFEQLRDQILEGRLPPGEALPSERELCRLLGVNRGALREGLKRLEESRLVEIHHGGGTRVLDYRQHASMSVMGALLFAPDGALRPVVARSLLEMRSALAPDVARLAALRRDERLLERLGELLSAMEARRGSLHDLQLTTLDFWDALVDGSDNLAYRFAFNTLRDGYARFLDALGHAVAAEVTDLEGYRELAAAVREQDHERAERRARDLMRRSGEGIEELLEPLMASRPEGSS